MHFIEDTHKLRADDWNTGVAHKRNLSGGIQNRTLLCWTARMPGASLASKTDFYQASRTEVNS